MVKKIFRMESTFTGTDKAEINTIYYALEKEGLDVYMDELSPELGVSHNNLVGVFVSDQLYQAVTVAGGLLGLQEFPDGDISHAAMQGTSKILNIRDPFWYKDNVQETIPVNPSTTQKESVMSTARAKAQPSAVASAASQAVNATADKGSDKKEVPLSKVMEAAATAAQAIADTVSSATTQADTQQTAASAVEQIVQTTVETIKKSEAASEPDQPTPQPVDAQHSTQSKENSMADKTTTEKTTTDKKSDDKKGLWDRTKEVMTGPTAKVIGIGLLSVAGGAAGGYAHAEMQRRRMAAAKGRMA